MTEHRNAMAELFADCWKDEALKARFMSDPKVVLAERGIAVPDNINVAVLENFDHTVHIPIPEAPSGATELSDEELAGAVGVGLDIPGRCAMNPSSIVALCTC